MSEDRAGRALRHADRRRALAGRRLSSPSSDPERVRIPIIRKRVLSRHRASLPKVPVRQRPAICRHGSPVHVSVSGVPLHRRAISRRERDRRSLLAGLPAVPPPGLGVRTSLRREMLLLTVVVYLSGVAAATLEPNRPSRAVAETMVGVQLRPDPASLTCSSATLPVGSTLRAFCVRNAGGNVLLFIPLGILLPLVWRRLRFGRGMLIALGLSCSIELAQYLSRAWGSYRSVDANDVILNVAGAFLGLVLVSALRIVPGTRLRSEVPGRVPGL